MAFSYDAKGMMEFLGSVGDISGASGSNQGIKVGSITPGARGVILLENQTTSVKKSYALRSLSNGDVLWNSAVVGGDSITSGTDTFTIRVGGMTGGSLTIKDDGENDLLICDGSGSIEVTFAP